MGKDTGPMIPAAIMRHAEDLPLLEFAPGIEIQLLQVDFTHNIRATRARLQPGVRLPTHTHTGHVFAWTVSGAWKYVEYDDTNVANTYMYEPAGSVHTLYVPEDSPEAADVIFIVHGSNIDHDEDGNITSVTDAMHVARVYLKACAARGLPRPDVIGLPEDWDPDAG